MSLSEMREMAQWKFSKHCQQEKNCEEYDGPHMRESHEGSATYLWTSKTLSGPSIFVTVFARGGKTNLHSEQDLRN
jgi:hypothetical protein